MKYVISCILMFGLFLTLFTACGEVPEKTPESTTDVIASVVESQENNKETAKTSSAVSEEETLQEELATSKEESVQKQSEKTVSSHTSSVPVTSLPADSTSSAPVNTDAPVADINVEYPTFTGEGSLREWLTGEHADYFADKRGEMMSTMGNKDTVTYYRPSISANNPLFVLSQVQVHTPSRSFDYSYNGTGDKAELVVFVAHDTVQGFGYDDMYNLFKSTYENQESSENAEEIGLLFQHDAVDFYGLYTPTDGSCYIAWQQFGFTHFAGLHGHFDRMEEIIPLLYLQQVKVDSSAVMK